VAKVKNPPQVKMRKSLCRVRMSSKFSSLTWDSNSPISPFYIADQHPKKTPKRGKGRDPKDEEVDAEDSDALIEKGEAVMFSMVVQLYSPPLELFSQNLQETLLEETHWRYQQHRS
jgi:hypothetical protein